MASKSSSVSNSSERVLLVQTAFLGDVVLSTPAINAARQLHPHAELYLLTTPVAAPLFQNDPRLTRVLTDDKRKTSKGIFGLLRLRKELRSYRFNRAYALQRSIRTGLLLWLAGIPRRIGFRGAGGSIFYSERRSSLNRPHAVERHCALFDESTTAPGVPSVANDDRLSIPSIPDEDLHPEIRAALASGKPPIVLIPGSAWATKQWSVERYAELALRLHNRGFEVVVAGAPSERALGDQIAVGAPVKNLVGIGGVRGLAGLIERAGVLVANDSAPLHIAAAYGTSTVAIFCSTTPNFGFTPWRTESIVLEVQGLPCKPCGRHGRRSCPLGTNACMNNLPAGIVEKAVLHLVENSSVDGRE
jgi:heptosyltransferase-2